MNKLPSEIVNEIYKYVHTYSSKLLYDIRKQWLFNKFNQNNKYVNDMSFFDIVLFFKNIYDIHNVYEILEISFTMSNHNLPIKNIKILNLYYIITSIYKEICHYHLISSKHCLYYNFTKKESVLTYNEEFFQSRELLYLCIDRLKIMYLHKQLNNNLNILNKIISNETKLKRLSQERIVKNNYKMTKYELDLNSNVIFLKETYNRNYKKIENIILSEYIGLLSTQNLLYSTFR